MVAVVVPRFGTERRSRETNRIMFELAKVSVQELVPGAAPRQMTRTLRTMHIA